MNKSQLDLYIKYHSGREYTSIGLWNALKERYAIKKVLYPGCYVHITPSLVFEDVTYVDNFRNTYKFYEDEEVREYIRLHCEYNTEPTYTFFQEDYENLHLNSGEIFDMIISQYAGLIGQATKKYLKKGGILVCNNSHGDASAAFVDPDYELIAVYNRKSDEKFTISTKNLHEYGIPKKEGEHPDTPEIKQLGKGVVYTKSPTGYIFQKD